MSIALISSATEEMSREEIESLTERYQEIVVMVARRDPQAFLMDREVQDALDVLTADPLCHRPESVRELVDMILWSDAFEEPGDWSLLELVAREGLDI